MITVRVSCTSALSADVVALLARSQATSALAVHRGASLSPVGDVIEADLPRESINSVVDALVALGVAVDGTIQLLPVHSWVSARGLAAEQDIPGASPDAVVWTEVIERAYEESSITYTFISFMILATLLAGIAVVTDSVILVIGAMVLGPEFVPIAALGLGLVRRRYGLIREAATTLAVGFGIAIAAVATLAAFARAAGLISAADVTADHRPGTAFIYSPNVWSLVIAVCAGAAGVLALTSAKSGGLVGVFISVTTIPAAGNIAVASVFGAWTEVRGSTITLLVNIIGMALAGWATLAIQQGSSRRARNRTAGLQPDD